MGSVKLIKEFMTDKPISMIGYCAGVCYGSDLSDDIKNYKRGIECLENEHGRTFEFPDVYMMLDEYSARVMREWYTHIGGMPTRLQASTRYIDYEHGFGYVTPPSIDSNSAAKLAYEKEMESIKNTLVYLDSLGIPREDSANLLPLGMETKVMCKHNLRNLMDMSHQRMCSAAYHEYRKLFRDIRKALSEFSEEWRYLCDNFMVPKCVYRGMCTEKKMKERCHYFERFCVQ